MLLWTIQSEAAYKSLEKYGTLTSDVSNVWEESFIPAYNWMRKQMTNKIGKAPNEHCYPIWAWYQWEGLRKRPDMRKHTRSFNHTKEKIYLLTLDVPDEEVLLSDFDNWHYVLGNWGLVYPYEDRVYTQEEKEESWHHIFDITCSFDPTHNQMSLSTQATMWQIKKEWVIRTEEFWTR